MDEPQTNAFNLSLVCQKVRVVPPGGECGDRRLLNSAIWSYLGSLFELQLVGNSKEVGMNSFFIDSLGLHEL